MDEGRDYQIQDVDDSWPLIVGVLCWLLIPFVIGRLADANISPAAGNLARPSVVIMMLAWSMYRPSESRLRMVLLQAIDAVLGIGLLVGCVVFVIALITANFEFRAVHPIAWPALAAAGGLVLLRFAIHRWIRFTS